MGVATNGDEYVPDIVPVKSATTNHLMVSPPIRMRASNIKTIVKEFVRDLPIVSLSARSAIYSNGVFSCLFLYSRIRSKTTIVSCTEKLIVVKKAVTKSVSTSTPKKAPKRENTPRTTRRSCMSATIAEPPNLMLRNA